MAQQATVLILADVGDSERAALEEACAAAGFSPSIEPSAEAATQKLTAKRYDALIVHLGTPGAALACMRARGKLLRTRIPVLALVDSDDEATFARAYRAGADEVLLLDRSDWLGERLKALPRSAVPQPGNARGDAVVADADRTRAEVVERVLRDAGFRVEVAVDGFSTRLQAGRPSLKVAIIDASLDDVPSLILQAKAKGARCAWVVRARPEQLEEIREKLSRVERVAVLSAYGPPDDVLFEVNRLIEPRTTDGRGEGRLLQGSVMRLKWRELATDDLGYSYNWSATGIYVRTLATPPGAKVRVKMTPPGADHELELDCEVVWRREFGATRKEPVPAGFALRIVGGDVVAWARICPRTSSPPPPHEATGPVSTSAPQAVTTSASPAEAKSLETKATPAPVPVVAPFASLPTDVQFKPRATQTSVEAMLASVLSESSAEEEEPGAAPLSIDGGAVVALHTEPPPEPANTDDQITKVQKSPLELSGAGRYTSNPARQEMLDANKTPLAIPRGTERPVPRRMEQRATSVIPRPNDPSKSRELRTSMRPAAGSSALAANTSSSTVSGGAAGDTSSPLEPRRKSDRPPPEAGGIDLSDITPASIGFDLSEDGRIIEEVRRLPAVEERKPGATVRPSLRPSMPARSMQSASRGGTLAGTGGPAPFDLKSKERTPEPAKATLPSRTSERPPSSAPRPPEQRPSSAPRAPDRRPSSAPRASEPAPAAARIVSELSPPSSRPTNLLAGRPSERPTSAPGLVPNSDGGPESSTKPRRADRTLPSTPPPGNLGEKTATIATVSASHRVFAEGDRSASETVRPFSDMGVSSANPAPVVAEKLPKTTTRVVADADASPHGDTMRPSAAGLSESAPPPPLAGFGPSAVGGSPPVPRDSLDDEEEDSTPPKRRSSLVLWIAVAAIIGGGAAFLARPSFRTRAAPGTTAAEPAPLPSPSPSGMGLEKASDRTAVAPAEPAAPAAAPTSAPSATLPATPSAPADTSGAEVDQATLAALAPGQGYLYVASPLTTNVYLYGILAGTTNQRITSKCGPRFIRLGTAPGTWQGEGLVQIVKCGALTRIEMGK